MENSSVSKVFLRAGVLFFDNLSRKGNAAFAGLGLDELRELLAGEISRMCSHKVEEAGLLFRIAERLERPRVDGKKFHRE